MINLCDSDKYFTDSVLTGAAKRIPRAVEDIEIIGSVLRNETIVFPTISGQCGINEIASLKINFYSRLYQLEIIGNGPNNTENTRQPTGTDLTSIQEKDPLRFNHGWYTINPAFTVGTILTNGNIKLNNLGFNNSRTDCFNLLSQNSIIANNTLSLNKITLTSNSRAYDSQFTSNIFLADSSIKMDNMVIEAATGNYTGGSYYNCQLFHSNIFMSNAILLDSSLNIISGSVNACQIYRSAIESNDSSSIVMGGPNISGSSVVLDKLYLEGGNSVDSSISANLLYTSDQTHSIKNGSITAKLVDNSSFINSGIISFDEAKKLNLTNTAQVQINYLYKNVGSNITNNTNSLINIISSGYLLNGNNDGTIVGGKVDIDTSFINQASGVIFTKECNLYNTAVNYGIIANCNLYNRSNNASASGGISSANFYDSSTNNGFTNTCNFYDLSQNFHTGIQQATFYSGSINNASFSSNFIGSLTFKNSSKNKSTIYNARFYDSGLNDGGTCYNTKFYDFSQSNSGPLINTSFYNNSEQINNVVNASGVNFYDNSKFYSLKIIDTSGSLHLYDNSSGNILDIAVSTGLRCSINNNSIVSEIKGFVEDKSEIIINDKATVLLSEGDIVLSFQNQSVCGPSSAYIKLYNSALATGSTYTSITGHDNSQIINNSVSITSLVLKDNSKCLSRSTAVDRASLYDRSQFYGNNITSGAIYDNAKLMFAGGFTSTALLFANGSQNDITINTTKVIFSGSSSNGPSGFITANQATFNQSSNYGQLNSIALFRNNSTNYYKKASLLTTNPYYFLSSFNFGSGNNTMHFGSGSVNYGYVENGLFYENSVNAGVVKNGTFHSTVFQTGTVLENGVISDISWSDPF